MARTTGFVLSFFFFLFLWMTGFPSTNTNARATAAGSIPLYRFAQTRHYQVQYNLNLGYADIASSSNTVRVFFAMPYIVASGNIHYLQSAVRFNARGEVELPAETAKLVQNLLAKPAAPEQSSSSEKNDVSSSPASSSAPVVSFSSASSSGVGTVAVPQRDGFIPVNAIVLDPGHGGKDPGGLGVNGIQEKEIVLAIMKNLGMMLVKEKGIRVFVTRNADRYVSLKERTDLANGLLRKNYNPIFVSIHGNISLNRKVDGIEVYSLSDRASDDEALTVETMENAGFSKSDVEKTEALSLILGDLLKDGMRSQSSKLSYAISREMKKTTSAQIRGIKKANFYVLKYNSMPSVLVEVGFLSSTVESKNLLDRNYQKKLASGIYNGIVAFLNDYNTSRGFTK